MSGAGLFEHDRADGVAQALAQALGGVVAAALAGQQLLELLLQAVLGQARRALVKVVLKKLAAFALTLVVEVEPDLGEDLGAVGLVLVTAVHDVTSTPDSPRR